ncbi:MAG TPA: lipid-A-disaccharide synthase N-terminal domain-containing protein [Parachlamydiaceae bacterium]|nr:lipid-A-disaccharide synthase N-terminal domain-containing protein [Parachlamydiaceae bacterium]
MDYWREFLYPLGFLSSLFFTARILIQWALSEAEKKSVVPLLFWKLSFAGNCFLMLHAMLQVQFHVFIIQVANGVISWRNLNLMRQEKSPVAFKTVLLFLIATLLFSSLLFSFFNNLSLSDFSLWFRSPISFLIPTNGKTIPFAWHVLGFIGLTCFSSRFWVQWILAEKKKTSYFSPLFWWLSLIGDLLVLVYFAKIKDPVNLIGPFFGLVPYVRNLILLKNTKAEMT